MASQAFYVYEALVKKCYLSLTAIQVGFTSDLIAVNRFSLTSPGTSGSARRLRRSPAQLQLDGSFRNNAFDLL